MQHARNPLHAANVTSMGKPRRNKHMKNPHFTFTAILFALTRLGLLSTPESFGVLPPPDGGYPGGNTAEGQSALLNLTTGGFNTAVGFLSLKSNTAGQSNTAIGAGALLSNAAGGANSAFGVAALASNFEGSGNTAIGYEALLSNTGEGFNGNFNTAVGSFALKSNHNGSNNTAIGNSALSNNIFGIRNVAVGQNAGNGVIDADNVICIGTNVAGFNVGNSCFIGNIYQNQVGADSLPVRVDSSGKLGTEVSSKRFKRDIKPMDQTSEAILALKPVTFHYNSDNTNRPQFGLIAEDVAKVNADLIVRDNKGQVYTVRYEAVNAMLLNEFLKEHRKVQDLEAAVTHQQNQIQALVTSLQKVNTRVDANPGSAAGRDYSVTIPETRLTKAN
jgi:trimeric autotransporter adhesin